MIQIPAPGIPEADVVMCEHCGSLDKWGWTRSCRYVETLPKEDREGWTRSGADAPCSCDEYDRSAYARRDRSLLCAIWLWLASLGVTIWVWYAFNI